jgi:hypothetical protein
MKKHFIYRKLFENRNRDRMKDKENSKYEPCGKLQMNSGLSF